MQKKPFFKIMSIYLALAMVLMTLPAQGWAMFIPTGETASTRQADVDAIQKTLESTVVTQRLMDLGLSSQEAVDRLSMLSDEQVHQFAAELDSLQAGGVLGSLIFLLLVAVVVVLVLQATGHRVIIR